MSARAHDRGYDKIGPTAHVTAYAWYQLGMPYAHLFATREGAAMYWSFHALTRSLSRSFGLPTLLDYLEFRHRMIGAQLLRLDPDRVVELGAGLSHRGLTWALDHRVRYTEIDLPPMHAAKRARIEAGPARVRAALDGPLELCTSDILGPSFTDELAARLAGAARPVVVSEGMLDYLALDDRERLASSIAAALRRVGGGHYLTDTQHRVRERRVGPAAAVLRRAIKLATRGQGPAEAFTNLDHIERTFTLAGFDRGRELSVRALAKLEPRLAKLRSPTTIWLAEVEAACVPDDARL